MGFVSQQGEAGQRLFGKALNIPAEDDSRFSQSYTISFTYVCITFKKTHPFIAGEILKRAVLSSKSRSRRDAP